MSVLAAIQLVLLAGLTFAVVSGLAVSLASPLLVSHTACWSPERRHRALLLSSVAPALLATFGVLAVLAPSLLAMLWPEYDHCLIHSDHHVHLCFVHLPAGLGNAASWLVLGGLMAWASSRWVRALMQLFRARQCFSKLRAHGKREPALGASVLPTATPLCLVAGIFKPTIVLSEGLVAQLSQQDIAVILHHERAHGARRDILLRLVARAATLFMGPGSRSRLLAALDLAAEQSCDELAAVQVGDRLQVADTILKVERLLLAAPPGLAPLAMAFGGNSVPERVSALLEARRQSGNTILLASSFALILCGVLAASAPLHHLTESLLGALTH
jgi:hypothetical protein